MPASQVLLVDLLQAPGSSKRSNWSVPAWGSLWNSTSVAWHNSYNGDMHIRGICHCLHGRHVSNLPTCQVFLLNVPNCTDGNYLVEPTKPLRGSLRRTKDQTCAYNVTNRDCVPLGTWNLETGDVIDLTYGLGPTQLAGLYYRIFGGGY